MRPSNEKTRNQLHTRGGFTLIELLVVISIISLLIAILMPQLSAARNGARTLLCATQLRSISDGMHEYASGNEGWIVGSPAGSGSGIVGSIAGGAVCQNWDFMGPIAKEWGWSLPESRTIADMVARFNTLRSTKPFLCPSNPYIAPWFDGPQAGAGPLVSYNTVRYMLMMNSDVSTDSSHVVGDQIYNNSHEQKIPPRYVPMLDRIGDSSRKVFCADGGRYSTVIDGPDYDLKARALWGGSFSDVGPYSTFTRSWDRSGRNGGSRDPRLYAFRHSRSTPRPFAPPDELKLNLVFFDGHVELMGDLEASNPYMWIPARSQLELTSMFPDVAPRFGLPTGGVLNIPN